MKLAAMAVVILAIVIVVGFAPMTPAQSRYPKETNQWQT